LLGSPDQAALLKAALGSNAIAHAEIAVDIFTLVSVLFVTVKLAATTVPRYVRLPAAFMVAGWFAVCVLLLLLHSRELADLDMERAASKARRLQRELTMGNKLMQVVMCLPFPFFVYVAYMRATSQDAVSPALGAPFAAIGLAIYAIITANLDGTEKRIEFAIGMVFLALFVLPSASGFQSVLEDRAPFFAAFIWVFCVMSSLSLYFSIFVLLSTYSFPEWPAENEDKIDRSLGLFARMASPVVVLGMFAHLLWTYDATGTFSPDWLDLLG
jgi:hypothetical protein